MGMTREEMQREIERLKAEVRAKASLKVSAKGAVSLYGLGRFPVTLYVSQWEKLFSSIEDIKAFIKANEDSLKTKENDITA